MICPPAGLERVLKTAVSDPEGQDSQSSLDAFRKGMTGRSAPTLDQSSQGALELTIPACVAADLLLQKRQPLYLKIADASP
jgi:hypothetical protein